MTNQRQLAKMYADRYGTTVDEAYNRIGNVLDLIRESLLLYGGVQFRGFGTFKLSHRNPRRGRNPSNPKSKAGEYMIAEHDVPMFHASKALSQQVNERRKNI